MPRLKIPLQDGIHIDMLTESGPPKVHRALHNLPRTYIFRIDEESTYFNSNWFTIINASLAVVPCLQDYLTENQRSTSWRRLMYPHNSITDHHETLLQYLKDNIIDRPGIALETTVARTERGLWEIAQPLYVDSTDLILCYRRTYIPRLRSMERITNITFTRKLEYDEEFILPCKEQK